ncbi:META domain-containing protein [Maridesulfovibrio salexigens]|uniref:Heat shock protein HslJ n=1 Tax=Maridesulfovibrio salexigens (strain ATCC 14822 / DSM 2638 / NCIMB 8403 / VKM B-1763) TaxID=526222 RepID=C6C0G2_MARSD|nr:META domain-containing protein [Maridesulfovibrio salexigens]ACS79096.1 protein of unknown function DUF306 Meta and HslJ [Maridesulfovibrio salexigens DSM 2638]
MKKILILGILLFAAACSPVKNSEIYWVNSYKQDCVGVGPMKCMLVQKGENPDQSQWQNFYSQIEGFEYQPGFIYKLKVKEEKMQDVPADASSIKYTLLKVLEKKEDARLKLSGNWEAVKINGSVIKIPRIRGAGVIPHLNIDISEMQISGSDGCNNFNGRITKVAKQKIEWGPVASTMKLCANMSIVDSFNQAFNAVAEYRINGDSLVLTDNEGKELLEFAKSGTPAKTLLNDIWIAEQVDGIVVTDKISAPRLEINIAKMKVMGTDGCNYINGGIITLTNSELVFSPVAGTKKMCFDMTVPDKFNAILSQVRSYKIAELKLTLFDGKGRILAVLKKGD